MASTSSVSRTEILALFGELLRTARKFSDYNIRAYTKRRTVDGFRENRQLSDPAAISAAYKEGKEQLEVAKRQAIVCSLYATKIKSVMEVKTTE